MCNNLPFFFTRTILCACLHGVIFPALFTSGTIIVPELVYMTQWSQNLSTSGTTIVPDLFKSGTSVPTLIYTWYKTSSCLPASGTTIIVPDLVQTGALTSIASMGHLPHQEWARTATTAGYTWPMISMWYNTLMEYIPLEGRIISTRHFRTAYSSGGLPLLS